MHKTVTLRPVLLAALSLTGLGASAREGDSGHRAQGPTNAFNVAVPAHPFDLVLARPEPNEVTLSVLAYEDMEGYVSYGWQPGAYTLETPRKLLKKGVPFEWVIGALQADSRYYYQFRARPLGAESYTNSPEYAFQTARSPGSGFTFTLTADVHLDEHTSAAVYQQSLANIRADQPDFHIDLGNLFMTDKHATRDEAARQYLAQRFYLGQIGAPLLLALVLGDRLEENFRLALTMSGGSYATFADQASLIVLVSAAGLLLAVQALAWAFGYRKSIADEAERA